MKEVREYIANNWEKTFHNPSEMRGNFAVSDNLPNMTLLK